MPRHASEAQIIVQPGTCAQRFVLRRVVATLEDGPDMATLPVTRAFALIAIYQEVLLSSTVQWPRTERTESLRNHQL
jgi:hypothetical protein